MKRRMTLSIALALSVLLPLVSLPAAAHGQQPQRFTADTGVLTLGPGQILRVTVAAKEIDKSSPPLLVRFRRTQYAQGSCNSDGVCKHNFIGTDVTGTLSLAAGEAASYDIQQIGSAVRGVVLTNNRNARVVCLIINTATGKVDSFFNVEALP